MRPRISIIVPVYNAENYLNRCLKSLLSQTIKELEVIAVNDGSTDLSGNILNEYSKRDVRVKVVHKQNSGVSDTRNIGVGLASGEFIGFVDSDDWVDPVMYETMYHAAVIEQADIVMCTYIREFSSHSKEKVFDMAERVCYRGYEVREKFMRRLVGPIREEMSKPEYLDAWGTVWTKLYRSELIKENRLRFVDLRKIGSNEDSLFNIHACYYAKSIVFINKPYYHYWHVNNGSITSGYRDQLKEQWFNLYGYIEAFLEEKGLPEEFFFALNNRICMNTLGYGFNLSGKNNKASLIKKISLLNELLEDERIKQAFKRLEIKYFPHVWKVFYFLAKKRMSVPLYFMIDSINSLRQIS